MQNAVRIAVVIAGLFFGLQGLSWVFTPARAAESLGMPLLEGLGRSTQIGDLGAFFLGLSAMILLGATTRRAIWLQAAAILLGAAAVVRVLAFALHDAELALPFIAVEIAVAALLLVGGARLSGA